MYSGANLPEVDHDNLAEILVAAKELEELKLNFTVIGM